MGSNTVEEQKFCRMRNIEIVVTKIGGKGNDTHSYIPIECDKYDPKVCDSLKCRFAPKGYLNPF